MEICEDGNPYFRSILAGMIKSVVRDGGGYSKEGRICGREAVVQIDLGYSPTLIHTFLADTLSLPFRLCIIYVPTRYLLLSGLWFVTESIQFLDTT